MSHPIEIVGLIFHSPTTEAHSLPPSTFDRDFIKTLAQTYEAAGYDRVLIGQTATWPDNLAIASYIAAHTKTLKFMIAQRPGFIAPVIAARKLATIDQLSHGRAGVHIITAASDIETQCDGDFLTKEQRYMRSHEYVSVLRKMWSSETPVTHRGHFYMVEGAPVGIKPYKNDRIPVFWGGTSPNGIKLGVSCADIYALGGGPVADVAAQIEKIRAEASAVGRTLRFSMSMRILLADSDAEAWDRAQRLLDDVIENQRRNGPIGRSKDGQDSGADRVRKLAAMGERLDDCLWMGVTKVTEGRLQAVTLVGSPETVVASLLRYYAAGIDHFLLTGFDPIPDTKKIGEQLVPLLRERTRLASTAT